MTNRVGGRFAPTAAFPATNHLGYLCLSAAGGHPGESPALACIRRWISPADGTIRVEGTFRHQSHQGDGVRGRIVGSRNGKLGEWIVYDNHVETSLSKLDVKRGDALDFVVDCLGDAYFDSFTWRPKITFLTTEDPLVQREWDAKTDFNVKVQPRVPLTPWEQLAQVLLLSNELIFID